MKSSKIIATLIIGFSPAAVAMERKTLAATDVIVRSAIESDRADIINFIRQDNNSPERLPRVDDYLNKQYTGSIFGPTILCKAKVAVHPKTNQLIGVMLYTITHHTTCCITTDIVACEKLTKAEAKSPAREALYRAYNASKKKHGVTVVRLEAADKPSDPNVSQILHIEEINQ